MLTLDPSEISPTLAEFFNVPYYSKMSEEDIVLALWKYILQNKLLIDNRFIVLDNLLQPVMHPFFLWPDNDCKTEQSIVMIFIAKMHLDPLFIQQDIHSRLVRIRKKIACRTIARFYLKYRESSPSLSDETVEKKEKSGNIQQQHSLGFLGYIATHYCNGNGNGNGNGNSFYGEMSGE